MTDAAIASISTSLTVIVVALIQRRRDKKAKKVLDATHLAVNSNWKVVNERIGQLSQALQSAGVAIPPTPDKNT